MKACHGKLYTYRQKLDHNFFSVWSNHLGTAQHKMAIEQVENNHFCLKDTNVKLLNKTTSSAIEPNKCNKCNYGSSHAGNLRKHLKTHSGEKSNKCNQCDFASSRADVLMRHLKTHSGEKSNKSHQ